MQPTPILPQATGSVVFDSDHNEFITISDQMVERSHAVKFRIARDFMQVAEAFADVRDHRLYLVDGCDCFIVWIEVVLGLSRRHVYNHLRLVDSYANRSGVVQMSPQLERFGVSKLLDATNLPVRAFERFKRTGSIALPDGSELTPAEIESLSVREFRRVITGIRGTRPGSGATRNGSAEQLQSEQERLWHRLLRDIEEQLTGMEHEDRRDELARYEAKLDRMARQLRVRPPQRIPDDVTATE